MFGIELKRNNEVSLARQIYGSLRGMMTEGSLKPGETLPSTREMARQLAISRNTVCEAYEMLLSEGFIESRQGAPTRVTAGLRLEKRKTPLDGERHQNPLHTTSHIIVDFRTGRPDLGRFPRQAWLRQSYNAAERLHVDKWGYTGPEGLPELRDEIASWLFRGRGLTVLPQDIFITSGSTQALHLLAGLIQSGKREMIVEDPCHTGMLKVLQKKGIGVRPIPADKQGLITGLMEGGSEACAAYVTPSHQFPLGGILPASRRAALVKYAWKHDMYIIEDDYDSEFRYAGTPVAPLHSLDPQKVIYVGTFSKILFPALRIGYVVLPRLLHARWRSLRTYSDVQNPPFEQAALAEYLRTRKLDLHIRRMRKLYGQKRKALLDAMEEAFGRTWVPWGDSAGLHLALEFPGRTFDREFDLRCRSHGIRITPVEYHAINKGMHSDKLLLGYGHLEADEIRNGVSILRDKCFG